jgi:luciferase family oxidoreductase group 1
MPGPGYVPEIWLLGSSLFSAELAGLLGLPFSFAHHFSPRYTEPALERYRASFRPSALLAAPRAMVAVAVVCAPEDEQARYLAGPTGLSSLWLRTNRLAPLPTPETAAAYPYSDDERRVVAEVTATHVVGSPATVRRGLEALAEWTGADELMVTTRVHGLDDRLASLRLVAQAWGLGPD